MTERTFRLRGLENSTAQVRARLRRGSAVSAWASLSATLGGYTPPSPPDPDPPPPATGEIVTHLAQFRTVPDGGTGAALPNLEAIAVTASRASGPAPFGVSFQLTSADPNFYAFVLFGTAYWTFSGNPAEDYTFDYLTKAFAGETAGHATGPYVGHLYRTVGTHAWSVTLYYPGLPPRTVTSGTVLGSGAGFSGIEVIAQNTYFAGRTVYYSPTAYADVAAMRTAMAVYDSAASTAPDARFFIGAGQFKAAVAAAEVLATTEPWRVCVEAGTTTELTNATLSARAHHVWVCRIGAGANPILTLAAETTAVGGGALVNQDGIALADGFGREWGVIGIDMIGPYDPVNPGAGPHPTYGIDGIRMPQTSRGARGTIADCVVTGWNTNLWIQTGVRLMTFANCKFDGWYNYGIWAGASRDTAYAGVSVKQPPNTLNVGRKNFGSGGTGEASKTHLAAATWTARFDWAAEWTTGRAGPQPLEGAPAIPPEETAPLTGGWSTVSAWWRANFAFFDWDDPNNLIALENPDDAELTAAFNWAGEHIAARTGPVPRTGAPTPPTGYEAPTTGGWETHPGGPEAWAWWLNAWKSFRWRGKNADAFNHYDDDIYFKCAIHGPIRQGNAGFRVGWHQMELQSANGWSPNGYINSRGPFDQDPWVFAVQPCWRFYTAWPTPAISGHSASVWRVAMYGGRPALTQRPQRTNQSLRDSATLGLGTVFDGLIVEGGRLPDFTQGGRDGGIMLAIGRVAVRNSLFIDRPGPQAMPLPDGAGPGYNLNSTSGSGSTAAALSATAADAPSYLYNCTSLGLLSLPAGTYRGYAQDPDGRRLYTWNNIQRALGTYLVNLYDEPTLTNLGENIPFVGDIDAAAVPLAGSNALGAASLIEPALDALGAVRPSPAAVGAFEAAGSEPLVIGLLGQSENEYVFNTTSFYRQITAPAVIVDGVQYLWDQSEEGDTTKNTSLVTVTHAARTTMNPGAIALANTLTHLLPDRQIKLVDFSTPGTSLRALLDDAETSRRWSIFDAVRAEAVETFGKIDLLALLWWNSTASQLKTFDETFAPGIFGQRWNGSAFTLGSTVTDGVGNYDADRCFWDIEAAADETGRGVFTRDGTKLTILGPGPRLAAPTDVAATRYADASTVAGQMDRPARDKLRGFMSDTRVQTFGAGYGISTHVCKFGDTYDGVLGSSDIHPSVKNPDGQYLYAQHVAVGMAKALGAAIFEPQITGITAASDGSYADVIVSLPNGGTLTTIRKLRTEAAPDPSPPHRQPVTGFEIGASSAAVVPTGFTADVQDSGSGSPRTGTVRITPTVPFVNGDVVEYLRGAASAILLQDRDLIAALYKDFLIEHVPALQVPGDTHPYPGIPVSPQPAALVISGVTPADTTAPTLSSPVDTKNGETAMTGSVSTNENNGTLYWVVSTSATAPSAAQVRAGQMHTGSAAAASGSQSVTATGTQNISASGLTAATTYTAHFMHEDAAGNRSTVASADGFTTDAAAAVFFTTAGGGPYFVDPSNVPANTTRIEAELRLRLSSYPASTTRNLFAQSSTGCDLIMVSRGGGTAADWRVIVEDSAGTTMVSNANGNGTNESVALPALNTWFTVKWDVDQTAKTASISVDGTVVWSTTFTGGTGSFQSNRVVSFLAGSTGGSAVDSGVDVEFLRVWFTTSGTRTLRKEIAGNAATVNADAWKLGTNAT